MHQEHHMRTIRLPAATAATAPAAGAVLAGTAIITPGSHDYPLWVRRVW